jgi:general stress protein 26
MDVERLLDLARRLTGEVTFCVAATQSENGETNARVVQPRPVADDWIVDVITNRRCRKVREIERTGRLTLLYQQNESGSYVCLVGRAEIVEDLELKRRIWTPAHDRWNKGGPDNPDTVFVRLTTERIELWSAVHSVLPEPEGYSAALLLRDGGEWRYAAS